MWNVFHHRLITHTKRRKEISFKTLLLSSPFIPWNNFKNHSYFKLSPKTSSLIDSTIKIINNNCRRRMNRRQNKSKTLQQVICMIKFFNFYNPSIILLSHDFPFLFISLIHVKKVENIFDDKLPVMCSRIRNECDKYKMKLASSLC